MLWPMARVQIFRQRILIVETDETGLRLSSSFLYVSAAWRMAEKQACCPSWSQVLSQVEAVIQPKGSSVSGALETLTAEEGFSVFESGVRDIYYPSLLWIFSLAVPHQLAKPLLTKHRPRTKKGILVYIKYTGEPPQALNRHRTKHIQHCNPPPQPPSQLIFQSANKSTFSSTQWPLFSA